MADAFGPGDHNIHLRHGFSGVASPYNASEQGENRAFSNYPPPHNESNPSFYTSQTNLTKDKDGTVAIAVLTPRTPSPTPSENALLSRKGVIDWKKMMSWRFWVRREWLCEFDPFLFSASSGVREGVQWRICQSLVRSPSNAANALVPINP